MPTLLPALSLQELSQLVKIMHEMKQAATDANWQSLSRLDSERRAILKYDPTIELRPVKQLDVSGHQNVENSQFKSDTEDENKKLQFAEYVDEIQMLDKQIIATVQAARNKLVSENRELSAQVNAKNLYAKTSSMS